MGRGGRVAAAALREGRGGVTTRITGLYVRGYVALARGRLEEADGYLRESLAIGERSGDILRVSLPLWGLAESALLVAGRVPGRRRAHRPRTRRVGSGQRCRAPRPVPGDRHPRPPGGQRVARGDDLGGGAGTGCSRTVASRRSPPADRPMVSACRARPTARRVGRERTSRTRTPGGTDRPTERGRGPGRGWTSRPATSARDGSARPWRCWRTSGPWGRRRSRSRPMADRATELLRDARGPRLRRRTLVTVDGP